MKSLYPLLLACGVVLMVQPVHAADALVAQPPVELTGTEGKFDFIKIDSANNRLLACHTGNNSLDVVDVATSKLLKSVPTGAAQGVTVDSKGGRYFVSVSKPPSLVIVDAAKLEVIGQIPLPNPADLVAYHPGLNRVFVCNDEKPELWIIDPEAKTIVSTLALPGAGMEDLDFNADGTNLFQCLKDSNQLAKIDPKEGKVVSVSSTLPAEKPHGLAMVPGTDSVLVVGGNGKLSLINLTSGQVVASADVAAKVDEIAFDPGAKQVYCASGSGVISVVAVDQDKLTVLAPLKGSPGNHSIAVDPQTHTVWIAFAKGRQPCVQAFTSK